MKEKDKRLYELIEYIEYLLNDEYKVYYKLNKRHIKKINKLLKSFCREYMKEEWL